LLVVILGTPRRQDCFNSAIRLLNYGFANYRMLVPVKEGATLGRDAPVKGGVAERVPLVATGEVRVLMKRSEEQNMQVEISVPDRVPAPVTAGQVVGDVIVTLNGIEVGKTQAAAARNVAQASFWERWWPF
jgi:D-alanyl-D-alanine carboxypeptidase (penicillin-binding protein 5/6)